MQKQSGRGWLWHALKPTSVAGSASLIFETALGQLPAWGITNYPYLAAEKAAWDKNSNGNAFVIHPETLEINAQRDR
ncbi:hypothetical protein BDV32DRAFT_119511 [Aspergillus pseudonomiae]|uniref:Uncharacterized protein n=1 Tax=Aspergillus pseudonomiae TaxID=1506151 RepID=A0A5N6I929_9EURO|nr:uncharacterized protein BDV37DRAFT_289210 [Aspergillus pseudonomiae]KAB8263185.1 hypothetical protein BDV32DRAFT_119511 [Aspergillus pseudonomiae]KAE8397676.1 hypothetical protein BDV37DRAFT_289210 [Aspergillus pseudonomiae]